MDFVQLVDFLMFTDRRVKHSIHKLMDAQIMINLIMDNANNAHLTVITEELFRLVKPQLNIINLVITIV